MTIESSPPTHTPKATAHGHGAKARSAASEGAGSGSGSGFMAMLGALADGGDAASDTGNAGAPGSSLPGNALPDASLTAAATPTVPFDASALLQQSAQFQASTALQTGPGFASVATDTDTGSGAAPAALTTLAAPDATALPAAGALASLLQPVAVATPASAPVAGDGTAPATAPRAVHGSGRPGEALATAQAPGAGLGAASAEHSGAETQGLQHAAAHARANQETLRAQDDVANTAATPASAATADANKLVVALEQVRTQAARAPEPALLAPGLGRSDKPQSERANAAERSREPSYSGVALGMSSPEYTASAASAPVLAPDMAAAEQVSYWVSHNLQNAELTLDGLGQAPVEVSIRLQGHEAQIAFRSDEAATRSVLESAGAHLKELLQREGLVLTGVSVGQSGSGAADAGGGAGEQRRARQTLRQALVAPVTLASVAAPRRTVGVAGRSLDLFV